MELPCHFGNYDLDGNGEISEKEFLSVTAGFTKMDPNTLFGQLDTNGECINQIHRQDIFQMEGKGIPTNFIQYSMKS